MSLQKVYLYVCLDVCGEKTTRSISTQIGNYIKNINYANVMYDHSPPLFFDRKTPIKRFHFFLNRSNNCYQIWVEIIALTVPYAA